MRFCFNIVIPMVTFENIMYETEDFFCIKIIENCFYFIRIMGAYANLEMNLSSDFFDKRFSIYSLQ